MSTTAANKLQIGELADLSSEQQERAAAFAAREREHEEELAQQEDIIAAAVSGTGTVNYNVTLTQNSGGFCVLNWSVSSSTGSPVTGPNDWIGVFANTGQAMVNPKSNYLGGSKGWEWATKGTSYTTKVPLQPGYVAAYVIKNAKGDYVTVAVTQPYPS